MQGYPADDVGSVLQQILITLLGGILQKGEKVLHELRLPLYHLIQDQIIYDGVFTYLFEIGGSYPKKGAGFDSPEAEWAGRSSAETFGGIGNVAFEEELKANFLFAMIEPGPDGALPDEIYFLTDIAFA